MDRNVTLQFGSLVLDNASWKFAIQYYNLTANKYHPSKNLQILKPSNSSLNLSYGYLRWNPAIHDLTARVVPKLDYYFRPNTFTIRILCAFPLSGQYGFRNRLTFYLLMILALLVRKHDWLAPAALGAAMTQAASAAVHAFGLILRYRYKSPPLDKIQDYKPQDLGDIDLVGIFPILVAACTMLTPILHWSKQVREHARPLAVCWGLLIFAALVPTIINVMKGVKPLLDLDQLAVCDSNTKSGCTLAQVQSVTNMTILIVNDVFEKCHCKDTCAFASLPYAPFRRKQDLKPFLLSKDILELVLNKPLNVAYAINSFALCFIIVQGILGLVEVSYSPASLRNKLFLFLGGRKAYKDRTGWAKVRHKVAQAISLISYCCAIAAAMMCPLVFFSSVIINEIVTWQYPVSEENDAVGQWNAYVCAVFVIIAAIIQKYHKTWRSWLSYVWKRLRGRKTTIRHEQALKDRKTTTDIPQDTHKFKDSWKRVRKELEDFKNWWSHPIEISMTRQDSSHGNLEAGIHGDESYQAQGSSYSGIQMDNIHHQSSAKASSVSVHVYSEAEAAFSPPLASESQLSLLQRGYSGYHPSGELVPGQNLSHRPASERSTTDSSLSTMQNQG